MIRRKNQRTCTQNANMRGGEGTVTIIAALEKDKGELRDKGRLFSTITLPPGASIGIHAHTGEMEAYLIISGSGCYNDNGVETTVNAGDVTYTAPGESHAIANIGDQDLVLAALILYE